MPQKRPIPQEYSRAPDFTERYREEAERMHRMPEPMPQQVPCNDRAVLLPLLVLLWAEGADKYLLLALLYILL